MPVDDSPNGAGLSARHLARALDTSLRRLGLETVDLYQVHAYDPLTPLEETLRTLDQFIRAGKIRYWGLSNFTGWQLTKAVHLARALDVAGPVTLQPQYSLLAREIEWEIVPAAIDAGLGLLPWSPLGGGWLSGKYRRDQRPTGATRLGEDPGRGMEAYDRRGTDRTWAVIDAVQKIAEERSVRPGEQRAVAEQDVVDQPHVRRQRVGAVQAGQRDRRAGHVEVQRGPGLLGHQEQVDLPVAGQREGQHVPGAGPLAGQRPGRLAQDQADPLLPVCCHTATSASAGAALRAGAQNLPA
jgi:aryl-alcohol dehydrogenase-like predicted oxidoreductase